MQSLFQTPAFHLHQPPVRHTPNMQPTHPRSLGGLRHELASLSEEITGDTESKRRAALFRESKREPFPSLQAEPAAARVLISTFILLHLKLCTFPHRKSEGYTTFTLHAVPPPSQGRLQHLANASVPWCGLDRCCRTSKSPRSTPDAVTGVPHFTWRNRKTSFYWTNSSSASVALLTHVVPFFIRGCFAQQGSTTASIPHRQSRSRAGFARGRQVFG